MCTWFSASWRRFRYDRKCLFLCIYNPQITISPTSLFSANFNGNRVKNHPKPWTCLLTFSVTLTRENWLCTILCHTTEHWLPLLLWNYSSRQSTGFLCCFEIIHHCKALASFVALKLFTTAKHWLPLLLWNYSSLQSTGFLCCFHTNQCKALASFVALKLFIIAKHWHLLLLWNYSALAFLLLLLWNYSSLQSTGFCCCFETIHHCKALASFVALILINAKYWLPLLLWNYPSLQSTGFVVKSCSSSESKAFCTFGSSPHSTTLAVVVFSCCSSSGITSFLWYHSLLGEHWLSLVLFFKWELWLCSVFLTCWYSQFFSVFVVFLTLGVKSVSVISLTQPQTRTLSKQCSATDDLMTPTVFWSSLGHG